MPDTALSTGASVIKNTVEALIEDTDDKQLTKKIISDNIMCFEIEIVNTIENEIVHTIEMD